MNAGKILFDSGNTIPKSTRYLEPVKFSNKKIRSGHFLRFLPAFFPVFTRQMIARYHPRKNRKTCSEEIPKI